jgi:hypothetical protein
MKRNPIKTLRNKADRLYQELGRLLADKCEVCSGEYSCRHHYFPKSMCSNLRYDINNGIALCAGCHLRHHSGDPTIHRTVEKQRGDKWYKDLLVKKNTYVKTDKKFYEEKIKELQDQIEEAKS